MKKKYIVSASVMMGAFAIGLLAEPPRKSRETVRIDDLSWMAGRWQSTEDGDLTDEHWTEPVGGSMLGMCRLGRDGSKAIYELMLIEEKDGEVVYTMEHFGPGLKHRDQAPIVFDVRAGKEEQQAIFVSRDKARATRLTYAAKGKDSLHVVLEREREGKKLRDEFHLKRMAGG